MTTLFSFSWRGHITDSRMTCGAATGANPCPPSPAARTNIPGRGSRRAVRSIRSLGRIWSEDAALFLSGRRIAPADLKASVVQQTKNYRPSSRSSEQSLRVEQRNKCRHVVHEQGQFYCNGVLFPALEEQLGAPMLVRYRHANQELRS